MRFACVTSIFILTLVFVLLPAPVAAQTIPLATDAYSSDIQAYRTALPRLKAHVADLLAHGNYEDLDRLADTICIQKIRVARGEWLLDYVYFGLSAPVGSNPEDHIAQLKAWTAARPQSITAHVALAGAYLGYAWAARGTGFADTVTPEGWALFYARSAEAKRILDDAANLTPMCPQWFQEMQAVARAQGWDRPRTAALFAQAIKFEPEHLQFYINYADYLLPKWYGQDGDTAAFAKQIGDSFGGAKGDLFYFKIGSIALDSDASHLGWASASHLDWARLQRGHQVLLERDGTNNYDMNSFARLAWGFNDAATAKRTFAQIGDRWAIYFWKTRARFDEARDWANKSPDPNIAPPNAIRMP
jgi:hypothetical protein